jgi:Sap, sulfolipid-1-addressing protein
MLLQLLFLALEAALYPTLLAAVVVLLSTPRPGRLLGAYLAGGLIVSIGLGIGIVKALEGSKAVTSQSSGLSWGADLAIGGLVLLLAVALATRTDERFRERRRQRREAAGKVKPPSDDDKKEPWSARILARGSAPIVFVAGLVVNVPGAAYLVGLKDIAAGKYSTGEEIALIVGFNLIMFLLAEIPLAGLLIAPERTDAMVKRFNAWLSSHSRQIAIALCVFLGVFLVIRGIVNS